MRVNFDRIVKEIPKRRTVGKSLMNLNYMESPEVDNFLKDIFKVYQDHGMAIAHEDYQGGFEVVDLEKQFVEWMWAASDKTR